MRKITQQRLKEAVLYYPKTGEFTWASKYYCQIVVGKKAGHLDRNSGYVRLRIDGRSYHAHRLAWLYMTGKWPKHQIDHRDMNRSNNAWNNLREATHSQNKANSKCRRQNKIGLKGVCWSKQKKKWIAQLTKDRKRVLTAFFDTPEEAHIAYCRAASEFHGEFARGS